MLSIIIIDGATADLEALFVLPELQRASMAGYDAIMKDPARRVAELMRQTLSDLPPAEREKRRKSMDEEVLSDLESPLEE